MNDSTTTTDSLARAVAGEAQPDVRELEAAREIAAAFLEASRPLEVYRLALSRITALVGASFSSVFLRDPDDPQLLKLACAQNWPQSAARYLSQMRIRVGRGPTGQSVERGTSVQVEDVFADTLLREWWEPARELGFTSLITLPLRLNGEVAGALSFYFDRPRRIGDEEQRLLERVGDLLSATVARAEQIDTLRRRNDELQRENEKLRRQIGHVEEAERLKTEFLSNISHELRTPLTAILGHTYLLNTEQGSELAPTQKASVEKIDRAAGALLRLINDLLELSQVTLGRAHVNIAPDEAVALAQRAADVAGDPPRGVEFSIAADARVPLQTDGEKVTKILENLICNAYKFTAQGHVTVSVERADGDAVRWRVTDTGIGISESDHEAIFDEFRQVDGSSTRLYGGTGLGLALSRRYAQLLGGTIEVHSAQGQGSTFVLTVPDAATH